MSGIEVAGLVLGALPIIIELIKAYATGASTIRRYLRYKRPLRTLFTELDVEYVLHQNAFEQLLDGLVDDNNEREALLKYPGGLAWRCPELERKLKQRLSDRGYHAFVRTVKEINSALSEIKALLKFSPDGKPQFKAANAFKHGYLRLSFSLKKSKLDDLVSSVHKHGTALRGLINQSIVLEPSRSARRLPDLDVIRSYLTSVYTALRLSLQCKCKTIYVLHLQLEHVKKCRSTADLPSFRVVLLYSASVARHTQPSWTFEEFDIRPNEERAQGSMKHERKQKKVSCSTSSTDISLKPQPKRESTRIAHMCGTIHWLRKTCMGDYLGFLEDERNCQKLDLYLPEKQVLANSSKPSFLSLHNALKRETSRRRHISKRDCLISAVSLSSNLLQLYRTPWMTGTWSHHDIAFFESTNTSNLEKPFISRTLSDQSNNLLSDSGFSPWDGPIRNQFLFALGILLIELCLDAPFRKLRRNFKKTDTDIHVANQLLEEVAEEFGHYYSDAVRRCIRCDFDTNKTDLKDITFSRAVYKRVVVPLEDALTDFENSSGIGC